MKLPRWLVIGMWTTSVLAVLVAAGWWWVTWPERTAREFVRAWNSEADFDEVDTYLSMELRRFFENTPPSKLRDVAAKKFGLSDQMNKLVSRPQPPDLKPWSRSLFDLLRGRQLFQWHTDHLIPEYITIERGTVIDLGVVYGFYPRRSFLEH